jgi:molybdopterin-guanine dinucleotide biosynthesis protein A
MTISADQITGLILAGGRGSRMGGVDKGLQAWRGQPLALHARERLRPQVGGFIVNANRNAEHYQALFGPGVPVCTDATGDFAGPLAGFLAGLSACRTPWLVTAPCDSPLLPVDLVARLAQAAEAAGAPGAVAVSTGAAGRQPQPVFCLLHSRLRESLATFLAGGGRKIDRWTAAQGLAEALFDDEAAFFNANTFDDLNAVPDAGSPPASDGNTARRTP